MDTKGVGLIIKEFDRWQCEFVESCRRVILVAIRKFGGSRNACRREVPDCEGGLQPAEGCSSGKASPVRQDIAGCIMRLHGGPGRRNALGFRPGSCSSW